ncbi:unnamed protein product [Parascedosporium putredinis]|uniref:Uncharacterized protein n=1 Tax=Parascedosporium putredinis TaxID=1442378 RepID=A0A9P1H5H5_9PEZI|nr:unnamed protein product [Parascedosporium putredinis]CAI7997953.1 unnamed protein product [Parascedosporium putredinis]
MNTLKRPRPLGHEPEPVEALVNPSPLVTYPSYDIQFTDLPTGERINIEQTAAIYGLTGYYAIAVPRPYDYEPSRPYVVEKPPSMGVIASGDFINPVLKTHSPPSFVDEAIPSTRYLASYPALQPSSQAGVGRVDPRDQMGYTSQPSPTGYYDNEAHFAPALALRTELPRSETMLQQQTMASSHLSPQFANP